MIDHHHKIIFVHVPKTGGSSIEAFFAERIGLDWENRAVLLIRENHNPMIGPLHLHHMTAEQYVSAKHIPQSMFDEYYKFGFVRNPWSRLVSTYKYGGLSYEMSFSDYTEKYLPELLKGPFKYFMRPQSELLYDKKDNLLVDFLGRFENLQKDFEQLCCNIDIPISTLPHVNISNPHEMRPYQMKRHKLIIAARKILKRKTVEQRNFKTYQEYYNDKTIKLVADIYARDIELLGYTFE